MMHIALTGKILTVQLEHILGNSHTAGIASNVAQVFILPVIFAQATK